MLGENPLEDYEEWDVTIPPLPSRSRLYCLEPIGLGTPYVESLTSYIARIAEAHCVLPSLLISKEIFPQIPGYVEVSRYHGLFSDVGGRSSCFNGRGLPASQAVQALKQLTLRTDLPFLTCLPLAKVFPQRVLVRLTKAWCAKCYEEQRANSQVVYDSLIWSFQAVLICSRHHLYLNTRCPYFDCGKPLPGIARYTRPGYCSNCQRWLGMSLTQDKMTSHAPARAELDWQLWVVKSLGELLTSLAIDSITDLERQRVQQVLGYILQKIFVGNMSALAKAVGMSRNMIDYWYQGKKAPEVNTLLHFCFRLNLSLCDFFYHELDTLCIKLINPDMFFPVKQREKPVIQAEALYQILELATISDEYPPSSLKMVTSKTGHSQQTCYKINPSACQKIVTRYNVYIQERKDANFCRYKDQIRQIALQLYGTGITPTQKRITPFLSRPGILRNPELREYLHRICQEVIQSNKQL